MRCVPVLGLAAVGAAAERPVRMEVEGPITLDLETGIGTAQGPVRIFGDGFTVCCGSLEVRYRGESIVRLLCTRQVALRRGDGTVATADRVVYEAEPDRLTLKGSAQVWRGGSRLRAQVITLDLARNRMTADQGRLAFASGPAEPDLPAYVRACPGPEPP